MAATVGVLVLGACGGSGKATVGPAVTVTAADDTAAVGSATLELRPVIALLPPGDGLPTGLPPGTEVLKSRHANGPVRFAVGPAVLDGDVVTGATALHRGFGQGWVVDVTLDPDGVARFDALAGRLFPKQPPQNQVAIVVDDFVQASPTFQADHFTDSRIEIAGNFTEREARSLAAALQPR